MGEPSAYDKKVLFNAGRLSWKLHASQLEAYNLYRRWEEDSHKVRLKGESIPGIFPRVFVLDISRRWGKDFLCALIRCEDALRTPGQVLTYATALAKDVSDIVIPLVEKLFEDAPDNIRPVLKTGFQGAISGFHFHNGSVLKLVGIDRSPDSLRGRFSDGITISECGFVDKLRPIIATVLAPQLMGRLRATILLNSTPPEVPGHPWDELFCPDARKRGAYVLKTIDDNPLIGPAEKDEFIQGTGGPQAETTLREFYCQRIRSKTRTVVPEFNIAQHVRASPVPRFAHGYTIIDPGVQDLCGVICGYYDFERAMFVIRRDWAERNANTNAVVSAVREMERDVFANLQYWNATRFMSNPFQRYSDTDSRLIIDMNTQHDMRISAADKLGAEAAIAAVRTAFQRGQIEIHPDARATIEHVTNAVWNKGRTSYERSELYGHFDLLDCIKYGWRHVNRTINPLPPKGIEMLSAGAREDSLFLKPGDLKTARRGISALLEVVPRGWKTRGFGRRDR